MAELTPNDQWYVNPKNPLDIVHEDSAGWYHKSPHSTLIIDDPKVRQTVHQNYEQIVNIDDHFVTLEDIDTTEFIRDELKRSTESELEVARSRIVTPPPHPGFGVRLPE